MMVHEAQPGGDGLVDFLTVSLLPHLLCSFSKFALQVAWSFWTFVIVPNVVPKGLFLKMFVCGSNDTKDAYMCLTGCHCFILTRHREAQAACPATGWWGCRRVCCPGQSFHLTFDSIEKDSKRERESDLACKAHVLAECTGKKGSTSRKSHNYPAVGWWI